MINEPFIDDSKMMICLNLPMKKWMVFCSNESLPGNRSWGNLKPETPEPPHISWEKTHAFRCRFYLKINPVRNDVKNLKSAATPRHVVADHFFLHLWICLQHRIKPGKHQQRRWDAAASSASSDIVEKQLRRRLSIVHHTSSPFKSPIFGCV